ncbi:tetratricopeptide repeat protein [Lichenifustis flavocetrariae]|uniref:tetratricopeptide repeat protein n=1 Tax=Lichenifustis flavocetrariae TaxID=2949735 RepID=UPI0031F49886
MGRTATFEVHDSSPKGRAIAALAKARLVTVDEAAGKQVVRLAHDTLLSHWDRARQVLSKRKGMVVLRTRLYDMVDNWKKTRDPAYLLKGLDLEAANALVKEEPAWVSADLAALVHGSNLALDAEKDELKRRARRERLRWQVASAGSGVLVALLVGLYWYSQKATRAELEATRNLELASQAVQTLATKGFERFVTLSLPSDYGRELLATARDLQEKIASKDAASPPVRFQQAVLLGVTSSYANALGDRRSAEQDIAKAITILRALVEQDPENVEWQRLLAKSNVALGEMLVASGDTTSREKAIVAFNDAQTIVDALLTANPIDPLLDPQDQRLQASIHKGKGDIAAQEWQDAPERDDAQRASLGKAMIDDYTSMYNILKDYIASDADKLALSEADRTVATAYLKVGQVGEAARYAKEALLVVDQLLTGVSTRPLYQQQKAEVLLLLGRIYVEENEQPGAPAGQTGKVINLLEQARTILVDLVETDPGNDVWRHDLFDAQRRLAALLATPGNAAKARPIAQAAAETAEAIVVRHPNDIASVQDLVAARSALGRIDLDAGDIDDAIRSHSAARDAGENGLERVPAARDIQLVLADAEGGLAEALSRASPPRFDEAKVALQSRIDLALKLLISGRDSAPDVRRLGTAYGDMGHLYATRDGKSGVALDYYRNAIGQFEKLVTDTSSPPADLVAYGSALLAAGDLAEARGQKADALSFYDKGIDALRKAVAADPRDANARLALSTILATGPVASLRNGDEALALAKAVQAERPDDIRVFDALAAASARTGDFVSAVAFETKVLSDATFARTTDAEQRLAAYKDGKPWPQP